MPLIGRRHSVPSLLPRTSHQLNPDPDDKETSDMRLAYRNKNHQAKPLPGFPTLDTFKPKEPNPSFDPELKRIWSS
jgi:hypothetical protein